MVRRGMMIPGLVSSSSASVVVRDHRPTERSEMKSNTARTEAMMFFFVPYFVFHDGGLNN